MGRVICAVGLCCALAGPAMAEVNKEEWKGDMEERLDRLEKRLFEQEEEIRAKDQRIQQLEVADKQEETGGRNWFRKVEVGGLVEVEASHVSSDSGPDSSDLIVSTMELGVITQVNDWVGAEVLLLYEEETDNNGDLNVDTAVITLADPDGFWFLKAGQNTLPFGVYPTYMISDPITLELGETNDTALEVGVEHAGFNASVFVFQGDHNARADNFGLQLGLSSDGGPVGFRCNLAYLDNLAESDTLVDAGWITTSDKMPAWIVSGELFSGPFSLLGEYLKATESFADAGGEQPAVFNLEGAYRLQIADHIATLALGYQHSRDAANDNWGLPEKRLLGTLKVNLTEGLDSGIELKRDQDYAGARDTTVTAQLALEF
ncbi:MAG: LbtU family siderophore porin [Candidatus Thiodiazotropha sp.]